MTIVANPLRCPWAGHNDPEYIAYHDHEWGVPVRDETRLFEFLVLEGAQAGLSWQTVLRKRARYRQVFADFDPDRVARFSARDVTRLLADPGIIRNRAKVHSAIQNARALLALRERGEEFSALVWQFVDGAPKQNRWRSQDEVPAETAESKAMSRALKSLGFNFVGPTICYAYMQAVGMVNDHLVSCFRHRQVRSLTDAATRP